MNYDIATPDIQCNADKDGAEVFRVKVTGWNDDTYECLQKTYAVLAHDKDNAIEAASVAFQHESVGYLLETTELL